MKNKVIDIIIPILGSDSEMHGEDNAGKMILHQDYLFYANVLINSIIKYVKSYSYHIYLIDNSCKIRDILDPHIKKLKNITIIESKFNISLSAENHYNSVELGYQSSSGDYFCTLDSDTIFACDVFDYLVPLLKEYNFVSAGLKRIRRTPSKNMMRYKNVIKSNFFFSERKFLDKNVLWTEHSKRWKEHDNHKFGYVGDTFGNISDYCYENNLEFLNMEYKTILPNERYGLDFKEKFSFELFLFNHVPMIVHLGSGSSNMNPATAKKWDEMTKDIFDDKFLLEDVVELQDIEYPVHWKKNDLIIGYVYDGK